VLLSGFAEANKIAQLVLLPLLLSAVATADYRLLLALPFPLRLLCSLGSTAGPFCCSFFHAWLCSLHTTTSYQLTS
jgi:hypothetical protein